MLGVDRIYFGKSEVGANALHPGERRKSVIKEVEFERGLKDEVDKPQSVPQNL